MNTRKVVSMVVIAIGAVLLFFSHYIAERVVAGKLQVAQGQSQVDSVNRLFSPSPYSEQIGKQFTRSGQARIDAGNVQITEYEALAKKLQIAGIVVLVAGICMFIFWKP